MKKTISIIIALFTMLLTYTTIAQNIYDEEALEEEFAKEWSYFLKDCLKAENKTNRIMVMFDDFVQSQRIITEELVSIDYNIEKEYGDGVLVISFDSVKFADEAIDKLYLRDEVKWVEPVYIIDDFSQKYNTMADRIELYFPYVIKVNQSMRVNRYLKAYNGYEKSFALYDIKCLNKTIEKTAASTFKALYPGNSVLNVKEVNTNLEFAISFVVDNSIKKYIDYTDTQNHWSRECVENVSKRGLIVGNDDGRFLPDKELTIEEFMTIWSRLNYNIEPRKRRDLNIELNTSEWSKNYVKNVLNRMTDEQVKFAFEDSLDATKPITREQAAYLLTFDKQSGSVSKSNFTDISDSKFKENIELANQLGYFIGNPDNTFAPSTNITRAETAAVLDRIR